MSSRVCGICARTLFKANANEVGYTASVANSKGCSPELVLGSLLCAGGSFQCNKSTVTSEGADAFYPIITHLNFFRVEFSLRASKSF